MICVRCNVEMVQLNKWRLRPVKVDNAVSTVDEIGLVSFKHEVKNGDSYTGKVARIVPYMCPICGCVENHLLPTLMRYVLDSRDDNTFSSDV